MINVSELMNDPDFCSNYKVLRRQGKWQKGRFVLASAIELSYYGPVQPATEKELEQFPEGDRERGVMKFMCSPPKRLYITETPNDIGERDIIVSDQIVYDGELYKIIKVKNWKQQGFIRAFGYCIGTVDANG